MANKIIALSFCLYCLLLFTPIAVANSPQSPNPQIKADFENKNKIIIYIATDDNFDHAQYIESNTLESRNALCEKQRLTITNALKAWPIEIACYAGADYMAPHTKPAANVIALKFFLTRQSLNDEKVAVLVSSVSTEALGYHRVTLPHVYKYSGKSVFNASETPDALSGINPRTIGFLQNHLPF